MAKFTPAVKMQHRLPLIGLLALCAPAVGATAYAPQEKAARQFIQQKLQQAGLEQTQLDVRLTPPRDFQPRACPQPLQARSDNDRVNSRMRLEIGCPSQGWSDSFIVRADIRARAAVAARRLPAGSELGPDDIVWAQRQINDPDDVVGSLFDLSGLSNRNALNEGQLLRRKSLQALQLVKRGAEVRIVARSAGIEVSAAGEALASGRKGEVIRVRNVSTGKIIRATVSQLGEVVPLP
ncbi:flagella basal body P-ring formation protein FlgA [Xenophilus sp. AP218F]|nr:flagella basal body P-ring formation protein FlgA [Xenophilus sp. AP218F]